MYATVRSIYLQRLNVGDTGKGSNTQYDEIFEEDQDAE
jgi:hypothetical protein